MRSAALVLAGGTSSRMGGINKLTTPISGKPVICLSVESALKSKCNEVLVITGKFHDEISKVLPKQVKVVYNKEWNEGVAASIRAGIASLPEYVDAAIIIAGDQPLITSETLNKLLEKIEEGRGIAYSSIECEIRNPSAFSRRYFNELLALRGDKGAREVIERHLNDAAKVTVEYYELLDIDTEDELDGVRRLFREIRRL